MVRQLLGNLSFAGRMSLLIGILIFGLSSIGIAFNYITKSPVSERAISLPERIAATVVLVQSANGEQLDQILRAINSDDLKIDFSDMPAAFDEKNQRHAEAEWLIAQQLENPDNHEIVVVFYSEFTNRPVLRLLDTFSSASRSPLEISVSLSDGSFVHFVTRGSVTRHFFGVPPGFTIGIMGAIMALIAIWVVMRESRPLRELEFAVNAFASNAEPEHVKPKGASDLRKLTVAFNAMQARIAELVTARTLLLGGISHDLRTYLTRLRLRVESLPNEAFRDKAVRDLDNMSNLLNDALALAQGTDIQNNFEAIDISSLMATELADRDNDCIAATQNDSGELIRVNANPVAFRRMFNNLLDNACRYGTHVEVQVTQHDGLAIIHIDDDGPGIPLEHCNSVFEPFFTVDPSRSVQTGGSGLGLAIAKQIAESCGGTISATISPLNGARISIALPAA
ncbi:MAG: hypothetical protein COA52_04700 [Hyphomicrobiales bacterium]|nr:MAG: hypothetical protein COA52_04700 [Hyphomicrobiales bacterium]